MSGRARLAGGEPRKASQRHSRRAVHVATVIKPARSPGDRVHWRGYTGSYLRDADDGQAEIMIGERRYLIQRADLRPV
jgi:hypothetical protein